MLSGVGVDFPVGGLVALTYSRGGDVTGWDRKDVLFPLAAAAFAIGNVLRRYGFTDTSATPPQAVAVNETVALIILLAYALTRGRTEVFAVPQSSYQYFIGSGLLAAVALLSFLLPFAG